ncbi:hypothetical protein BP00DRAFT_149101 [Aspergillus indologenus CBS 114.80]|uniref:Uncharacterized protein n=1 Tax=Aspergillus indologenus CBS 114.80 TaxID=1450541 RepID=A0A2V5IF09_9EURO|nr:hypothetical protein BP00DRAFT_149101 [Aspergillus indologenus CBS 114.80]
MLRNWLVISCRNLGVCSLLLFPIPILNVCSFFFFSCTSLQVYYPYSILVFLQPSQSAEIANGFLGPGFMLLFFFVFLFLCAFEIPSV